MTFLFQYSSDYPEYPELIDWAAQLDYHFYSLIAQQYLMIHRDKLFLPRPHPCVPLNFVFITYAPSPF